MQYIIIIIIKQKVSLTDIGAEWCSSCENDVVQKESKKLVCASVESVGRNLSEETNELLAQWSRC
jgi:hypothetical protein